MKKKASATLTAVLVTLLVATVVTYFSERSRIRDSARLKAQEQAEQATQTIDTRLQHVMSIHRELFQGLGRLGDSETSVSRSLCETLTNVPILFGVGAAYVPGRFSAERELYAPYCREHPKGMATAGDEIVRIVQIEDSYDYTAPKNDWYHLPLIQKKDVWQEPHHGKSSKAWIVNITSPFFAPEDSYDPIGVGFTSLSLDKLRDLLASLELGEKGYSFLVSSGGNFIVHPKESYLGRSVVDAAEAGQDEGLRRIAEAVASGRSGYFDHSDELTGERSWVFHHPIPTSGWTLAVVLFQEEMAADLAELHSLRPWIVAQSVALGIWLAWLLLGAGEARGTRSLAFLSLAASLILVAGSVALIALFLQAGQKSSQDVVTMTSQEGLEEFLSDYETRTEELGRASTIRLPTGLFVQSVNFSGSNDVDLTGYVWQRYSGEQLEELRPGFIFPEAIKHKAEQAFDREEGKDRVIGWYFETTLRQSFDYDRYPFDSKQIWVRIWHRDFDKNVVLVPDLGAYGLTNPSAKPGLEEEIVTGDWLIARSFFGYKRHSYSTNFGLASYVGQDGFPELYYNILAMRESWEALTVHFILLVVVAVMLFAMLSSITSEEKKKAWTGFSFLGLLGGASGLFFVMNFAHVRLRGEVPENLVFLEWFYLLMYVVILSTTVTGFRVASGSPSRFLAYRDCLIPKLAYWPLLAGYAFCVSLVFFS